MSLKTLQLALFGAAFGWAIFPFWGGFVFLALELLLLITVALKGRAAKKFFRDTGADSLGKLISPEAIEWGSKHAFAYVWPDEAKAYGLALKVTSLMMIPLGIWFGVRGLLFLQPSTWLALIPALAVFVLGVTVGGVTDLEELVNEPGQEKHKPLHHELIKVVSLKAVVGAWSPPASP